MELLDFTHLPQRKKSYGGANGSKISILINNELYMLKLPSHAPKNENLSYANSCISEYLGCHIFNMVGIEAQETILGNFLYKDVNRIAVACKDFEKNGYKLMDFASVKNQIIDSKTNGYGTNIIDILEAFENQQLVDPVTLSSHFWNMFAVDALIGNWDRHNGNWGFLYNQEKDDIKYAPVFDCGSCLFPQMDDDLAKKVLKNKNELNSRIFDFPTSALSLNGKRINYYKFITSHEFSECDKAIKKIKDLVDIQSINNLIKDVPCLSDVKKEFLMLIIEKRYDALFFNNI